MHEPVGADPRLRRERLARGATWLAVWVLLTMWLGYTLANAVPNEGHHAGLGLLVTVPGIFSRLFDLRALQARGSRPTGWRRVAARAGAVVLGVPLAAGLMAAMSALSTAAFEATLAPLVAQVHAQAGEPCPPAARYTVEPALRDYVRSRLRDLPAARLYHAAGRFVLHLPGGSIDIDGSTIWYDSATRRWSRFHNDLSGPRRAFEALVAPMTECPLPLR